MMISCQNLYETHEKTLILKNQIHKERIDCIERNAERIPLRLRRAFTRTHLQRSTTAADAGRFKRRTNANQKEKAAGI